MRLHYPSEPSDRDLPFTVAVHSPDFATPHDTATHTSLDDVCADDPATIPNSPDFSQYRQPYQPEGEQSLLQRQQQQLPISDVPRLQQSYTTLGYRDGIAEGKAKTAQAGFDEGYGLGATLGARAGMLLGVLEGLVGAVGLRALQVSAAASSAAAEGTSLSAVVGRREGGQEDDDGNEGAIMRREAVRLEDLLQQARQELRIAPGGNGGVFAAEYFDLADGTWRYEVLGQEHREGEVVFADVADAHPLVRKWDWIVKAEAARYGIDWDVLKDEEVGRDEEEDDGEEDLARGGKARRERQSRSLVRNAGVPALDW